MREILFRGKRAGDNKWVYGFVVNGAHSIIGVYEDGNCFCFESVIPETVGQYTGLKDKNGTKIFEGDILLKGFEKVLVKWNSNQCRWGIYSNGYEISGFNESTKNYFEVIGNIHDNKNFLEE